MRRDVVGLELDNEFCRTSAFVSQQDVWQIFCPSSFRTSNAVLDSFRPGISRPIDSGGSDATVDVEHMSQFSSRHGFDAEEAEITVRNDAPYNLRGLVVDIAYEAGLDPHSMRSIVCSTLREREDPGNWSA